VSVEKNTIAIEDKIVVVMDELIEGGLVDIRRINHVVLRCVTFEVGKGPVLELSVGKLFAERTGWGLPH
jgi:hypothetical protein